MLLWGGDSRSSSRGMVIIPELRGRSEGNRPKEAETTVGCPSPTHSAPVGGPSLGIWSPVGSSGQRSPLL